MFGMSFTAVPVGASTPGRGLTGKEPRLMSDRPSEPHVPSALSGRITRISVTYTVNTDAGARHTFHTLEAMQKHARPERVDELVEDLTLICEDLLARRPQPTTGLPGNVIRVPFDRPHRDG
jgi:hypothetical protein